MSRLLTYDGPLLPVGPLEFAERGPQTRKDWLDWWEVAAVLRAAGLPAAILTTARTLYQGRVETAYQTVSPGWTVEPTWPVIIRLHSHPFRTLAQQAATLARYGQALTADGLRWEPRGPGYSAHLVVLGRTAGGTP